ncbi:MAG: hypothetical protein ACJ0G8_00175 [Dehalococcoidia bacterium]
MINSKTKNRAIIDIGSNSCRLVIFNIAENSNLDVIYEKQFSLKLQLYIGKSPKKIQEGIILLDNLLENFFNFINFINIKHKNIFVVATSAFRDLLEQKNNQIKNIIKKYNIKVLDEIIEAKFGFYSSINSLPLKNGTYFDIGGGSVEVVPFESRKASGFFSFRLGCLSLSEKFFSNKKKYKYSIKKLDNYIYEQISNLNIIDKPSKKMILVGGTARNIFKIHKAQKNDRFLELHGGKISHNDLNDVWEKIYKLPKKELISLPGLSSSRVDTIIPGCRLVKKLVEIYGFKEIYISGRGIREYIAINGLEVISNPIKDIHSTILKSE